MLKELDYFVDPDQAWFRDSPPKNFKFKKQNKKIIETKNKVKLNSDFFFLRSQELWSDLFLSIEY